VASSGALFLGAAGAFLLFVPLMSIATVAVLLGGLMLMFCLGFQAGVQEMAPIENIDDPGGAVS
jgi:energy-converting hydrogenase Eha subunit C